MVLRNFKFTRLSVPFLPIRKGHYKHAVICCKTIRRVYLLRTELFLYIRFKRALRSFPLYSFQRCDDKRHLVHTFTPAVRQIPVQLRARGCKHILIQRSCICAIQLRNLLFILGGIAIIKMLCDDFLLVNIARRIPKPMIFRIFICEPIHLANIA